MENGFVHLHLHSEYSLLDGACRISEIPKAAKRAGHTAVALTDHGVIFIDLTREQQLDVISRTCHKSM